MITVQGSVEVNLTSGEEVEIKCPECEDNYVHPIRVQVVKGEDFVTVTSAKEPIIGKDPALKGKRRGVRIITTFWCEHGHEFSMDVQFHKGLSFLSFSEANAAPTEGTVIWRD
jgi:hypothetical protein